MQTAVSKLNKLNKKKIFIFLVFSVALLLSSYIYLVLQTTVNIATYRNMQEEIISLDSYIGDLDFERISLKKNINLNMAKTLGYTEVSYINFVDKSLTGKKLSLVGTNN
ncbi:MAG: hypothetical protein KAJ58_01765 [Candidatus Pacebacteria bacterium]|nr:hypothetical protein [Candidatus Paceibacterota bacterium]